MILRSTDLDEILFQKKNFLKSDKNTGAWTHNLIPTPVNRGKCKDKLQALLWRKFKENTHSIHSQQTGFICIYDDQIVILFMDLNAHIILKYTLI